MPHRRSYFAAAKVRKMVSRETNCPLLENLWVKHCSPTLVSDQNAIVERNRRPDFGFRNFDCAKQKGRGPLRSRALKSQRRGEA
jgi:hypothetical protein